MVEMFSGRDISVISSPPTTNFSAWLKGFASRYPKEIEHQDSKLGALTVRPSKQFSKALEPTKSIMSPKFRVVKNEQPEKAFSGMSPEVIVIFLRFPGKCMVLSPMVTPIEREYELVPKRSPKSCRFSEKANVMDEIFSQDSKALFPRYVAIPKSALARFLQPEKA